MTGTVAIYVLSGCAVVAGAMAGGTLLWQEAAGVDTDPTLYGPFRGICGAF